MSVINKMLRDLDQRQSPATGAADPLRRYTASVAAQPAARRPSAALRWATGLLPIAAVVAGGFVWWSFQHPASTPFVAAPLPQVTPVPPEAVAIAQAPAPVTSEPLPLVELQPMALSTPVPAVLAASGPIRLGLRMDATLTMPTAAPAAQPAASAPIAVPAKPAPVTASAPPAAPAPMAQAAAKPQPPAAEPAPVNRQQQAGREALAQAQALWASGARDTAISTLQEAVATAERSPAAAVSASLVPLVRELARMELAEGRSAAVWELLTRLEPLLVNQPELWALRANAAQRLGRHQDSVQAYTTALQTRPSEQRWLLGAAVSLAALGQTVPAAEMADKARSVGPVSREVLAYLRQQGVPLTDRP